jgi:hypothetical protein
VDDWNVPPEVFERHISFLAEHATPVRLVDLHERLLEPRVTRPIFAVSFDDGYANLYQSALPVLMKHRIPATVFVVTSAVGYSGPMPFDAWSVKDGAHLPPEARGSAYSVPRVRQAVHPLARTASAAAGRLGGDARHRHD